MYCVPTTVEKLKISLSKQKLSDISLETHWQKDEIFVEVGIILSWKKLSRFISSRNSRLSETLSQCTTKDCGSGRERVKEGGVWSKIELEMLAKKLYFYTTQQV